MKGKTHLPYSAYYRRRIVDLCRKGRTPEQLARARATLRPDFLVHRDEPHDLARAGPVPGARGQPQPRPREEKPHQNEEVQRRC